MKSHKEKKSQERNKKKERGKRLLQIRKMLGFSQQEFANLAKVKSHGSVTQWEGGIGSGLKESRAKEIIELVNDNIKSKYGDQKITCSLSWLLYGKGEEPRYIASIDNPNVLTENKLPPEEIIYREMVYFKELSPDSVTLKLTDNNMAPAFQKGDHVAGFWVEENNIDSLIGKHCILLTSEEKLIFCKLLKSNKAGLYSPVFINPHFSYKLTNVKISAAAEVVRLWRNPEND